MSAGVHALWAWVWSWVWSYCEYDHIMSMHKYQVWPGVWANYNIWEVGGSEVRGSGWVGWEGGRWGGVRWEVVVRGMARWRGGAVVRWCDGEVARAHTLSLPHTHTHTHSHTHTHGHTHTHNSTRDPNPHTTPTPMPTLDRAHATRRSDMHAHWLAQILNWVRMPTPTVVLIIGELTKSLLLASSGWWPASMYCFTFCKLHAWEQTDLKPTFGAQGKKDLHLRKDLET